MAALQEKVRTCFWGGGFGIEAVKFWTSLLPDSEIESEIYPDGSGKPLVIEFKLGGAPYMILDVGSEFTLTPATSISVLTEDQAETDRLWEALISGGGSPMACGWLTDRFGLSWQIVPKALPRLMGDPDRAAAERTRQAMMKMVKLDIAALEAAFKGE